MKGETARSYRIVKRHVHGNGGMGERVGEGGRRGGLNERRGRGGKRVGVDEG